MNIKIFPVLLAVIVSLNIASPAQAVSAEITIGFNLPFTGWLEQAGHHAKNAAELVRKELEASGGLKVGARTYQVKFSYGDNKSDPSAASKLLLNQVSKENVIGIVGPLSSRHAIPVGQIANAFSTPMIASWSASPKTTKNRPFVFRSNSIFTKQGPVITTFVADEFGATKAAVLYDIVSPAPRGMTKNFKEAFEAANGAGSVVALETFRTGDRDFREQLERIKNSPAQILYLPQHVDQVALIVKQANEMGLPIPIVGGGSWAGGDLIGTCGKECDGLFYAGDYAPGGATGLNKQFVAAYKKAYNSYPDAPAALTWDATRALLQAIRNTGGLQGNLITDRVAVKTALAKLKNFPGASGTMSFNATGDPDKCVIIVRIDSDMLTLYKSVCQ
jgi:branched-chain amino acid transport system substrate-binding protein